MGTTARGITYPDPAGVPSRSNLQDLATSADTAIGAAVSDVHTELGQRMQSGTVGVSVSASATGFADVTFPTAFASAPRVTATAENSFYNVSVGNRTTTGVRLTVHQIHNASATATITVNWIAHLS